MPASLTSQWTGSPWNGFSLFKAVTQHMSLKPQGYQTRRVRFFSYQLYQESTWTHEIHLFLSLILHIHCESLSPALSYNGMSQKSGNGNFFPSLFLLYLHFFFSSILLSLKFLPVIKSQQEVKSQGFSY